MRKIWGDSNLMSEHAGKDDFIALANFLRKLCIVYYANKHSLDTFMRSTDFEIDTDRGTCIYFTVF